MTIAVSKMPQHFLGLIELDKGTFLPMADGSEKQLFPCGCYVLTQCQHDNAQSFGVCHQHVYLLPRPKGKRWQVTSESRIAHAQLAKYRRMLYERDRA